MALLLIPLSLGADMIMPSHNCSRPASPSHFASEAERIAYRRQAGLYRQCLSEFIDEQERAARMHSEAARRAGDELQRFGN